MSQLTMKTCMVKLMLLFLFLSATSQGFDVEKDKEKMRENNVKTQTKWKQQKNGENQKILTRHFDRQGNMIKEINYKFSGEASSRLTYDYNEDGQKTEYKNYDVTNDKLSYHQKIAYDDEGKKIKEAGFDGISNFSIDYSYYDNGKLKEIVKKRQSGEIEEKWDYTHDGNTTRIKIYKGGKTLVNEVIEKRNYMGKLSEKIRYDDKGNEIKKTRFAYDTKGKLVEEKEYFKGELSFTLYYSYDSRGNLVKIDKQENNGKKYINNSYNYDPENNLIRELWYEGNPDDYSKKTYNYDEADNLKEVDSYYSVYKYKALYKYTYEFY